MVNAYKHQASQFKGMISMVVTLVMLLTFSVYVSPNTLTVLASGKIESTTSSNIKYLGRWVKNADNNMTGYWEAGVEFRFTGQNIGINIVSGESVLIYSIDGGNWIKWNIVSGTKNFNTNALALGNHSLKFYLGLQGTKLTFSGFTIDTNASSLPVVKKKLIEFVGDSITEGGTYATGCDLYLTCGFIAAENLDYDHTHIAYGGIALVPVPGKFAMSESYFLTKQVSYSDNSQWDTNTYTPDAIVINLGTNDGVSSNLFKATYISFIKKLRNTYPNAFIFPMCPFNGMHSYDILSAVNEINKENDFKVIFINTYNWLTGNYTIDGIHPSIASHKIAATKLQGVLQPWLQEASTQGIQPSSTSSTQFNQFNQINFIDKIINFDFINKASYFNGIDKFSSIRNNFKFNC